ncbi:hypothetical protein D8B26_000394 [Coccidioides posadasii str. Silveira]|uniref:Calcineurin binding protein n=3 Tax=Coccidioides posadasii TaxID=199306 RepID=E9DF68_COCPS|nr:Calcipressin family protein [Coccidioides posadasii C735 delta SOWgp]EER29120.1 Calcipressin family protein [Coccidioides posadasii C735 delta SOWgp]EFW14966.1 calcineurin binding protein [Coccidioides posadasii str. Silveira]KMM70631.1 hypothetical protein CPAG_06942 [Coccidioides posadasii RMSCC 3488]QVM05688.1 hypothetical protein D8B26_000394 [Coccidioides posadasii str. Silveira]|eukprot:XP_003071265.1 Calcipressin family protein [Coccidioides posadasii C735 delta SOWgp]
MSNSSSPPSSAARRARNGSLTLDLSNIPLLSQPSPPSNTLLITELHNLRIFQPNSLSQIKSHITAVAPLNSFSPLPSLRRIVCSFHTTDAAVKVRQLLETTTALGDHFRPRIYFGEHTPVEDVEEVKKRKLLEAPHAEKLFFISPPPSPPHGWILRNEDPPNKEVHASDLADALSRLGRSNSSPVTPDSPGSMADVAMQDVGLPSRTMTMTQRSRSSTLIYHPEEHGSSPHLPAVMVEDTSIDPDASDLEMEMSPVEQPRRILAHTPRPPVELMH